MGTIRDFMFFEKQKPVYLSYADALTHCNNDLGYEDTEIVEVVLEKTKLFKKKLDEEPIHIDASLAFGITVLNICMQPSNEINVLDFGGACGANYFMFKKILSNCKLNWCVVETSAMCKHAKTLENEELHFYDDIQLASQAGKIDLLFSSGTLMYLTDPREMLKKLTSINAKYIFLTRLSLITGNEDIVTIQQSLLSENGIGKLPGQFKDKIVKYPHTNISENYFYEILNKDYQLKATVEDQTGTRRIKGEPVVGYGVLFQRT